MARVKQKSSFFASTTSRLLGVLAALIFLVVILEVFGATHLFHAKKAVSGTIKTISSTPAKAAATTQPAAGSQGNANVKNSTGSSATSPSTGGTAQSPGSLSAPFGTFVSNHHPGADGTPTKEQSTCTTTPGATCTIKFTQGSVVRSLPTQTTDNSGTTSWLWDIGQAGLTSGSWNVIAVSSLSGQSKTTADPIALEVQ